MFANRQAKPAWAPVGPGGASAAIGITSQQAQNGKDLPASGYGTYVSLISGTASQTAVVSPQ
jgi:hypothetical protein